MYNYFYTTELNLEVSEGLQKLMAPALLFTKTKIDSVEFTSRIFYSEGDVADVVLKDIDNLREQLFRIDKKAFNHDMIVEGRCNPALENKLGMPPTEFSADPEIAKEELEFWTETKLAVFWLYPNADSDEYLAQLTIYCYDDALEVELGNPATYLPNFSTTIN